MSGAENSNSNARDFGTLPAIYVAAKGNKVEGLA